MNKKIWDEIDFWEMVPRNIYPIFRFKKLSVKRREKLFKLWKKAVNG